MEDGRLVSVGQLLARLLPSVWDVINSTALWFRLE